MTRTSKRCLLDALGVELDIPTIHDRLPTVDWPRRRP